MKKSRFSDEQIIRILNEHRSGKTTKEICAEHNLSNATFYNWKRRFGDMDVQEARKQRALEEENARMKRIIADQAMQIDILKEINSKKVVSVKAKKQVARTFTEAGKASICFMCRLLELPRSSFYILSKVSPAKRDLEREIVKTSEDKPRYGYRIVTALMRRSGKPINVKRVQRVRSRHGLQVRKKQRKTRRMEPNSIKRLRASKPNEVWSWDFVYDETANGQGIRILSVVDEYTRQCFSLRPWRSYRATDVIEVLDELILENGSPVYLRSDNGPEFIAYALQDHLAKQGINTHYIKPGSPWEQPYVESFHDKLRDELLNREIFYSLEEAKIILGSWRDEYNAERPHSSLNYQTPNEYAEAYAKPHGATRPRPQQADVSLTTPAIHLKPRTNTMTLV